MFTMQTYKWITAFARTVLPAVALLCAPYAGGQVEPEPSAGNPTYRTVRVPGSDVIVATWTQLTEAGPRPFVSISTDGAAFTDPRPTDAHVRLRVVMFDPAVGVPAMPQHLSMPAVRLGPGESSPYIVQFIGPAAEFMLQPLVELGAIPRAYVPDAAQIMEMTPEIALQVAAMPHVRWVGPFHPGYRTEPEVLAELTGDLRNMPTRRYSIMLFERGPAAQQVVQQRIEQLGGIVNAVIPQGFRMEATLTPQQLLEMLQLNQVLFVDRWGPAGTDMNLARQIGGAVPLLSGLGFTGQGVRGHMLDDGLRQSHIAFANPAPLIYGFPPPVFNHGSSTYGIVFGNGAGNSGGTGMLPDREQGIFSHYSQLTGQGGVTSRYTMTEDIVDPALPYRAVFQSNSWGGGVTTAYTTTSAEFDDMLFLNDLLVCQSQSNQGSQLSRPEAWAKNAISVGGIAHQNSLSRLDDTWTSASFGPAADGRVKPDLAHFYDSVFTTDGTGDSAYRSDFCCTSAATPIVCGHAGLLMQMWHEEVFPGFGGGATVFDSRPRMATAKALLINSAFRYNWLNGGSNSNINRTKQGWGMPDLATLYNARTHTFIVNGTDPVTMFVNQEYEFTVDPGQTEFRATMVYSDLMGNPAAGQARINDLSLRVVSPGGAIYWGNNGLNASNVSTAGGSPNSIDTVENVFVPSPQAGTWTVTVFGHAIVQDGYPQTPGVMDAVFSLVVAPVQLGPPCLGDIAPPGPPVGDGVVGTADLLTVINAWGPCLDCPADFDSNGTVAVPDLLTVINAWGACP